MNFKIIILAIIFSLFLLEKTSFPSFAFSAMQISDALPVQFWLTGCETYNEHDAPGIHHKCYCAPWECTDEIKIQFKDDPSQDFALEIYDIEEQLLDTLQIDEIQQGVYEVNLNLAQDSPDVCDQLIILKIKRNAGLQGVALPGLGSYATDGGAGTAWVTGSAPNVTRALIGNSEQLYADYAFIPGVTYNVTINFTVTDTFTGQLLLRITDSSFVSQFNEEESFASPGAKSVEISFVATSDTTRIVLVAAWLSNDTGTVTINSTEGQRSIGADEYVAKSDCLDVRQDHPETILLTYSNHVNFAGLVYVNNSPETEFEIRVPAIFFHQRFPEEDEVMELTDELVTLNGTVRKQKQLYTDYVPYYFHEKMKLILKHQNITINNTQWVKQEAYEIIDGNRQHPLKRAVCWLSQKDFVQRNIL